MFATVTVAELTTMIVSFSAIIAAVVFLVRPIISIYKRLEKDEGKLDRLEKVFFTNDGFLKVPTLTEFQTMDANIKEIKSAVNILTGSVLIILDNQIGENNVEQLRDARAKLLDKREFV